MRIDTGCPSTLQLGVRGDLPLHLPGGIEGIVGSREGRHDLIADGLDDGAVVLLGGLAHHVDAGGDHVAGTQDRP